MKDDIKTEIQNDIGHLAQAIGQLSLKYKEDPLCKEAQKAFMALSVHVGRALDIQLQ